MTCRCRCRRAPASGSSGTTAPARPPSCAASSARRAPRAPRQCRPQRRRQDHPLALHRRRRAAASRHDPCRRRRCRHGKRRRERAPRHRLRAAGAQRFSQPERRAEPAHRRAPVRSVLRHPDLSAVPGAGRAAPAARRLHERRRAADAGARHGADDETEVAAARRAVDRPRARDRRQRDAPARRHQCAHGRRLDLGGAERAGDPQGGRADDDPAFRPHRVPGVGRGTRRQRGLVEMVLTPDRAAPADLDILVVGAGAWGLAAAIAAHRAGVEVAVIEKLDRPGGNSALSTGSVPAAGTRFQRDAGIADSPERFAEDLMRTGGPTDCPHLVRRLVETSAATVEWLVDCVGVRMTLVTAYKHVGHSVPRLHAPASRRGRDLVDDLLAAAQKRGIPLALGNGARELIADASGAVIGADIETSAGERHRIAARKTVLAVNGFAGNRDLVARFCPEVGGAQYFGARGSTGEAVLWGERLGAALGNIGAYQGYAVVCDPHGSLLSWTTIEEGGIIVNGAGRRVGDESGGYSGYTPDVMAQGGPCFAIFDQKIFDVAALEEEFVELANYGGIRKADTPAALAKLHGLDPAAIAAALENYNRAARGDERDAFGRRDFALAPLAGALYVW